MFLAKYTLLLYFSCRLQELKHICFRYVKKLPLRFVLKHRIFSSKKIEKYYICCVTNRGRVGITSYVTESLHEGGLLLKIPFFSVAYFVNDPLKIMSFRQYIHGFYDDIINSPFENKDIQKSWLICDKN